MSLTSIFGLLGGLGLFLFGMQQMSEGLQRAAGDKMRRILELFTSRPLIAILTGALVTAVVQSSSSTTVMVVGFVNTGLMNLTQAVGTVMGANIGTTITAQVVAFDIGAFALPCIGVGAIIVFLSKNKSRQAVGLSILGFGMLFLGMQLMSDSISPLNEYEPFIDLLIKFGRTPILGVLAGFIFTAILQSSSATAGLVIALSIQGLIDLPAGLAIALGANVGTCVTAMLASVGTNLTARRAAIAHLMFNTIGVVTFLLLFKPFVSLVTMTSSDVTRQIANAHTLFNVSVTVLFYPFIHQFVAFVEKIVPGQDEQLERKPKFLDHKLVNSPGALISAQKESHHMAELSLTMLQDSFNAFINGDEKLINNVLRYEDVVNELERNIIVFLTEASQNPWSTNQSHQITNLLHSVHDIERVGDHSTNIVELAQSKIDHKLSLSPQAEDELKAMFTVVESIYIRAIDMMESGDISKAKALMREDDIVDQMEKDYRSSHIKRLGEGVCLAEIGVLYLDIVANLERIADHANNLAEAIADSVLSGE